MELKVGKTYISRSGEVVRIISKHEKEDWFVGESTEYPRRFFHFNNKGITSKVSRDYDLINEETKKYERFVYFVYCSENNQGSFGSVGSIINNMTWTEAKDDVHKKKFKVTFEEIAE